MNDYFFKISPGSILCLEIQMALFFTSPGLYTYHRFQWQSYSLGKHVHLMSKHNESL